ncbi:alpha-amylase family glycosyl hydrolase [Psychromonas aquimarina]|uniref:alpha-amylase family glycosyl hydrolase n=1 Tax=Psychromonas aquimarina TaxID=444919 RepID=UPI00041B3A40|nr:alpha-amylase family glycosyl hydrolase [Psychromonas aquimarina]
MKYAFSKISLALSLALTLSACNSSDSTDSTAVTPNPAPGSGGNDITADVELSNDKYNCYQGQESVSKTCGLVTYQIMVESFIDGDSNIGYGTGYGTSHHEGDLQGVIDSLDYIKSLGVNAIWLTPIFQSTAKPGQTEWVDRLDATGYFTSDYFKIDSNFGDLAKAKEMVEAAHAKGLYVFFDGVFGHHKGNVAASPNGLTPTNGTPQGDGFEASYPSDLAFYKEVAAYWINELKIDGWRLDQAYQVPTAQWIELRKTVEAASSAVTYKNAAGETVNPLGYMVGEIWKGQGEIAEKAYGTTASPALTSAFDFPMRYKVVQTFAVEESGNGGRPASNLNSGFMTHLAYPAHAMPNLMLGNHDLVRFGDLLQRGKISSPSEGEYWARHKAAFSFMTAYSGPITLYYGEEIGDEVQGFADKIESCSGDSGLCDDHVARSSAKIEGVNVTLNAEQADLKSYVSSLMAVRSANPALYNGSRTHILSSDNIYIDRKDTADNHVLYAVNVSSNTVTVEFKGTEIGSDGALTNLLSKESHAIAGDVYSLTLAPFESMFLNIESPTAGGPQVADTGSLVGSGFMAACDNPDSSEADPLSKAMYIRGSYAGGGNFAETPASRQFSYKGQNTYQVVVNESAVTSYSFKFAAGDWSTEFAVADSADVIIAQEQAAAVAAGAGTESSIVIPEAGSYVFSFSVTGAGDPDKMMVSKCAE